MSYRDDREKNNDNVGDNTVVASAGSDDRQTTVID